jgi:hypothetical protein
MDTTEVYSKSPKLIWEWNTISDKNTELQMYYLPAYLSSLPLSQGSTISQFLLREVNTVSVKYLLLSYCLFHYLSF